MCIMSPKLVETGRHLNIDILTMTEVEGITGEPGDFTVRLRKRARFVDTSKCTGCGDCATACPILRPDEFNALLSTRKAVYQALPAGHPERVRHRKEAAKLPAATPAPSSSAPWATWPSSAKAALPMRTAPSKKTTPSRRCAGVCAITAARTPARATIAATTKPVNIMQLKRFVTDWALAHPEDVQKVYASGVQKNPDTSGAGKKVAIVGSGPAGLTAANDLIRQGYSVTVFEALAAAGGMMRVGIPEYRLPYDLVQKEVDDITALGVELKLNHRVDDVPALLDDFDAVFVAVGAHTGIKLPIPGNDLPQTSSPPTFCVRSALEKSPMPNLQSPTSACWCWAAATWRLTRR